MKGLFVVAAFCLAAVSANAIKEEDSATVSKLKAVYEECMFENGLTEESLKNMEPEAASTNLGCVVGCLYAKLNLVDEHGKINVANFNKIGSEVVISSGQHWDSETDKIAAECGELSNYLKDKCEKFIVHAKCFSQRYFSQYKQTQMA